MAKLRKDKKNRYLRIGLPAYVRQILETLEEHGFEAYAVGGCVRDSLLGRTPEDWDITTSAQPREIKACFRRTVDTGIRHGTVTVLTDGGASEVTTYRIDGEYKDGRHPSEVTFTDALSEDLKRRDFTINAMAYNDKSGLVDLFGGRDDLRNRVVRCVGDPNDRFEEDALRILRAVRFAAQLDFDIASATRDAVTGHTARLRNVSKERVMTELTKLVCSAHIERTEDIFQLGMVPCIAGYFREINIAQLMSLKNAALRAHAVMAEQEDGGRADQEAAAFDLCAAADADHRYIRFAFLTEGMDPSHADVMLKDLKADNVTRKNTVRLCGLILQPLPREPAALKELMSSMSPELFMDLLRIKLASKESLLYGKYCAEEDLFGSIGLYNAVAAAREPVYMQDLAVSGQDLIARGFREGPALGSTLKAMLAHVWACPEHNTQEWLLENFSVN